jgi:RNA polymerase sigma-70 factor (ECF subfamily)
MVKTGIESDVETEAEHSAKNKKESLSNGSSGIHPGCMTATADESRLQQWIESIVDRDQTAFAALYQVMVGRIYGLAFRITRSEQLAEEVAEDTFWQLWRQAPRFDPARGTALAWMMTMARSRALDALRRKDPAECSREPQELADAVLSSDNPPDLLAALQDGEQLQTALGSLDPVPRQLLALAFFCGFSHEEIAGQSGLPLGTVKSHIRRALISLRQIMAPDVDPND